MDIHISFVAEEIAKVGNFEITNSILTALLATILIVLLAVVTRLKLDTYNPGTLEVFTETAYEGLYGIVENIIGHIHAKKFFGFVLTFFIFVLFSNWLALLPFVPSVGVLEESHVETSAHITENIECLLKGKCFLSTDGIESEAILKPIFRAPTADLSNTMALALISVVVTNIVGIVYGRFGYLKKYFNFKNPIDAFVGILELISELGKIISFAFRLFGNIFAGEVLLTVMTTITMGIATLPFLGLEIFVGVIQAFVFFMLTTVFISLALDSHH